MSNWITLKSKTNFEKYAQNIYLKSPSILFVVPLWKNFRCFFFKISNSSEVLFSDDAQCISLQNNSISLYCSLDTSMCLFAISPHALNPIPYSAVHCKRFCSALCTFMINHVCAWKSVSVQTTTFGLCSITLADKYFRTSNITVTHCLWHESCAAQNIPLLNVSFVSLCIRLSHATATRSGRMVFLNHNNNILALVLSNQIMLCLARYVYRLTSAQ